VATDQILIIYAVKCLCIIFYSGNIPNYDNCGCCKMHKYGQLNAVVV